MRLAILETGIEADRRPERKEEQRFSVRCQRLVLR